MIAWIGEDFAGRAAAEFGILCLHAGADGRVDDLLAGDLPGRELVQFLANAMFGSAIAVEVGFAVERFGMQPPGERAGRAV